MAEAPVQHLATIGREILIQGADKVGLQLVHASQRIGVGPCEDIAVCPDLDEVILRRGDPEGHAVVWGHRAAAAVKIRGGGEARRVGQVLRSGGARQTQSRQPGQKRTHSWFLLIGIGGCSAKLPLRSAPAWFAMEQTKALEGAGGNGDGDGDGGGGGGVGGAESEAVSVVTGPAIATPSDSSSINARRDGMAALLQQRGG